MASHAPSQGTPKPRFVPRPWVQPPCVRAPRRSGSWERGATTCVSVRALNLQKAATRVLCPAARRGRYARADGAGHAGERAGDKLAQRAALRLALSSEPLRSGQKERSACASAASFEPAGATPSHGGCSELRAAPARRARAAACAPGWRLGATTEGATRRHPTTAAHPRQRLVRGVVDGGVRDDAHHHRACRSPGARRRPSGQPRHCQEPAQGGAEGALTCVRRGTRAPLPFHRPWMPSLDAMATIWRAAARKENRDLLT